ncbi:MAG: acetyl-CoA decarbonylase/synthase complex subunit delta [Dehalococcoidales bacterium]|jgi:acetyl-CoA decarbonylase/synthase complex subunit delta|nr:acetyl-CoA decarbonylase/synthase complex subunit delta [Dehalococcoidales bacterium]MDP7285968.1 acetyl-CoA decarbonylase/synthase complex subunit delta [Dehalococcoidales bacterium]MDP7415480.1 acetyl-CoA decarbonylase/synthase complex subunit delta [Dehalococcoidales bacterium]
MAFEIPKTTYNGKIKEIKLGKGDKAVTIGGESSYPFYLFESEMPHLPRIAMDVYDCPPVEWAEAALEPFAGVTDDPVAWAQKCLKDYGAEMICLQLLSTDPNGLDRGADEAAEVVKKVAEAIDTPLIVWGTANHDKDTEVLRRVAEVCQDKNLILGPVEEGDHKKIGAAAIGYHHTVIASTPIDINLAKQLNILLGNLGVPDELLVMDPTVSGIGYGIEYAYSVMERMRMAALTQQDEKLQFPIICNIAKETWKTKETKISESENPKMGDAKKRGILLEAMSAMTMLLAGGDVLIMRHPEAIKLVREMITELTKA